MFTVDDQKTTGLKTLLPGHRLWRALARLGQRPQFLVTRLSRRTDWFLNGLTPRKAANLAAAVGAYLTKRPVIDSWPVFVVVDLSPLCNLHCTVCLHAYPDGNPDLEKQQFTPEKLMSVSQYARLVDEIKDYSLGVLPWYLGDPIVYPHLLEVCRITAQAGLNCHISTNFSRSLSDGWIEELIASGLTHLTVCLDGLTQETYERTRVGGRLDLVISNLRRACRLRRRMRRRFPRIEVQFIKYRHNLHQLPEARKVFRALGVDQMHELWGWLHNYTDRDPGKYSVFRPRRPGLLPRCHWLHLFTVVKYNGDVLPCCAFRLGEQYVDHGHSRAVGNAFATSLRDVWTSPAYRDLRRFACQPTLRLPDASLADSFCDACPRLSVSDYRQRTCRFGNEYHWEDFYYIGPKGRTIRRSS